MEPAELGNSLVLSGNVNQGSEIIGLCSCWEVAAIQDLKRERQQPGYQIEPRNDTSICIWLL